MKIDIEEMDGGIRLLLAGELDHHAARAASDIMDEAVSTRLPHRVAVDLSRLTFMDSSGIAVLLRIMRRMEEAEGVLCVENTPAQAKKVLLAAGMDRLMSIR